MPAIAPERLSGLRQQLEASRTLTAPIPKGERHNVSITELGKDGFVRFNGKVYQVTEVSTYTETDPGYKKTSGPKTQELTLYCVNDGSTVYLEWERDDRVIVYVTQGDEYRLRDVRSSAGSLGSSDSLERVVDEEEDVTCNGTKFEYDDDWPAFYERRPGAEKERVYFYEFEGGNGTFLTIEKWEDVSGPDYQVYISREIPEARIEIISKGG